MPVSGLLSRYRNLIDETLDRFLADYPCDVASLKEAMIYAASGGKRLRGALALSVCEELGGQARDALNFALAIEMVQAYSLVHDDLPCMDDDDFRRGKLTCHRKFGEALALLCGDALLTLAFEAASSSPIPRDRVVEGICLLAEAAGASGMVGGQVLDLSLEDGLSGPGIVKRMYRMKTGELFGASAGLGAVAAGACQAVRDAAVAWGRSFGYAYQIIDDLEDAAQGGKEADKDTLVKETSAREAALEAREALEESLALLAPLGDGSVFAAGLSRHYADRLERYMSKFVSDT